MWRPKGEFPAVNSTYRKSEQVGTKSESLTDGNNPQGRGWGLASGQESGATGTSGYKVHFSALEISPQHNTPHTRRNIEFHLGLPDLPLPHGNTHTSTLTMILLTQKQLRYHFLPARKQHYKANRTLYYYNIMLQGNQDNNALKIRWLLVQQSLAGGVFPARHNQRLFH